MRFLADENVSRSVIRWLRERGHDVLDVEEAGLVGEDDANILERALAEDRVVITHDKDFGQVLVHPQRHYGGVILIRLRNPTPSITCQALQRALANIAETKWSGQVVVVEEALIRISQR